MKRVAVRVLEMTDSDKIDMLIGFSFMLTEKASLYNDTRPEVYGEGRHGIEFRGDVLLPFIEEWDPVKAEVQAFAGHGDAASDPTAVSPERTQQNYADVVRGSKSRTRDESSPGAGDKGPITEQKRRIANEPALKRMKLKREFERTKQQVQEIFLARAAAGMTALDEGHDPPDR